MTQAAFEGELIPPDAAARDEAVSRTGRYVQQNQLEYTVQDAQGVMWYASVDPLQRRLIILIREAELGENLRFDSKGKLQGEGITPLYRAYQEGRRRAWATWNIKRNEWRDDGNGQ